MIEEVDSSIDLKNVLSSDRTFKIILKGIKLDKRGNPIGIAHFVPDQKSK